MAKLFVSLMALIILLMLFIMSYAGESKTFEFVIQNFVVNAINVVQNGIKLHKNESIFMTLSTMKSRFWLFPLHKQSCSRTALPK